MDLKAIVRPTYSQLIPQSIPLYFQHWLLFNLEMLSLDFFFFASARPVRVLLMMLIP